MVPKLKLSFFDQSERKRENLKKEGKEEIVKERKGGS